MKQIKFRVYDEKHKKFWSVQDTMNLQISKLNDTENGTVHWMQFTGLLDKNGKEIYEGDIVEDVSDSDLTFEVKWNKEQCGYWMPEDFSQEAHYPISHVQLEIVGNIYENLELLKK